MDTQSFAIQELTKELPLNDFGLPTGIYRTDMLPFDHYEPPKGLLAKRNLDLALLSPPVGSGEDVEWEEFEEDTENQNQRDLTLRLHSEDELVEHEVYADHEAERIHRIAGFPSSELHAAFVPLQYEEGFPAFDNGIPFWSRMEFEPIDAFQAFSTYIEMAQGSMGDRDTDVYEGHDASGTRCIMELAGTLYPASQQLQAVSILTQYYHLYYWGPRAHAYDLYKIAEFSKRQETRAIETQGSHYYEARRLRHRLSQYMDSDEDFWDLMTPKVAIDMMDKITKLERISAGLPAGGPAGENEGGSRPMEVIFRNVANQGRKESSRVLSEEGEILDNALEDVETTRVLQELIIRGR